MLTVQNTILIVGIGLTLLSLCSGLPNVNDVEAKRHVLTSFQHAKRQLVPTDNGTCVTNAVAGDGLTVLACILDLGNALATNTTATVFCSSTCNAVYNAYLTCYGAQTTRLIYSTYCRNGYQGAASHVTLNFAVVLMSVFIAAVLKITG